MPLPRPRRLASPAVATAAIVALPLVLAACGWIDPATHPNTTFQPHTEFGAAINDLWNLLLRLGVAVFIFVEALLFYAIFRFREKPGARQPEHVHGNTTLEILWTVIPAVILVVIAVPTVRTIFLTQAKAESTALQVDVYAHQWWWEFRYPQYGVTTADELYLPIGRKVNFALRTVDVLHSFWAPQLGGKRDVISNHTNYLWYTPDSSLSPTVFNGTCNEYCGDGHANMRWRAFLVSQADFERWAAHQASPAIFPLPAPAPACTGRAHTYERHGHHGHRGAPGVAGRGRRWAASGSFGCVARPAGRVGFDPRVPARQDPGVRGPRDPDTGRTHVHARAGG